MSRNKEMQLESEDDKELLRQKGEKKGRERSFNGKVSWVSFRFQCGSCFEWDDTNCLVDTMTTRNRSSLTAENHRT